MKNKFIVLFLLSLMSCSQINTEERAHYEESKSSNMRHGIIVVEPDLNTSSKHFEKLDAESIARGKVIYQRDCLSCHGAQGKGDGPRATAQGIRPANLKKMVNEVPSFKFHMAVSQWQGTMPGWKNPYSASELDDLSTYLKSFRN
jgi:cytochrome c553